jgi:anti-anti-sigma factor
VGYEFQARTESQNGITTIALSGEIDMQTVPAFQELLTQVEDTGPSKIVLDIRDLVFMDSTCLKAFWDARDRAETNGRQLILTGARPFARRLFKITRTEFLLDGG